MNSLLQRVPRFVFFTGKGGVGKTTMACGLSVALADRGRKVLLISTDPASNLDETLETRLSNKPIEVNGLSRLHAMNIDPMKAAEEYREKLLSPYRGILPADAIKAMEEQLSGGCTVEVASFNEFARIVGDENGISHYDHVVLDTAPTGHTLRLLSLPAAWSKYIDDNQTGNSCLGPLSTLENVRVFYEKACENLKDKSQTLLVLVARPDSMSLLEAGRANRELFRQGMKNRHVIVNGIFSSKGKDPIAAGFARKSEDAIRQMPEALKKLPITNMRFFPHRIIGLNSLRYVVSGKESSLVRIQGNVEERPKRRILAKLQKWDAMLNDLSASGKGVVMLMGKGGVGKTSIASAVAVELARRGHRVLLTTTDPASHVSKTVRRTITNLDVACINPKTETKRYRESVIDENRSVLSKKDMELLEEELRSPCIEEIAVFKAFAKTVEEGEKRFVVIDTAPTGHTLLLLDATESYHREASRNTRSSNEIRELLPRLRNWEFTKVLITTIPETTPVSEAKQLSQDLQRAGIRPFAWIINQSFAVSGTKDALLKQRGANELKYIDCVVSTLSPKTVISPWLPHKVTGSRNLKNLIKDF